MTGTSKNISHMIYRRLHGENPGESASEFLKHLSWIGASFAAAKVISGLVSIAAGRVLGPAEYGKINVFTSVVSVIAPFILLGINHSIIKYGSGNVKNREVFGTASAIFTTLAFLVCSAVFLFRHPLGSFFHVPENTLLLALCYALGTSGFFVVSSVQQATGGFSKRGFSEVAISLLLAAGFALGVFFLGRRYEAMAYAYIAAFGLVTLYWFLKTPGLFDFSLFSRKLARPVFEYGIYYFGAGIGSFLIFNVQSLILNASLSPREVGVYAAYYAASIGISGYLGYTANTVIFPKAAASTNRRRLWDIAARTWGKLFPAAALLLFAAEAAILSLMGRHQYGMDLRLMVLFAVCGTLMLIQSSMGQIVFSDSIKASRLALFMSLGAGALNFVACLFLIPVFKIEGVAISLIITYVFLLAWLWKSRDSYLDKDGDKA